MSKIIDKNVKNGVVVVSTEGYFNKDLGEALKEITDQEIKEGHKNFLINLDQSKICLLYTSPSPRDATLSRMPSSA